MNEGLIDKKFGALTVYGVIKSSNGYFVLCRCECGKKVELELNLLKVRKSCGCGGTRKQHGYSRTKEYQAWHGMMHRCYDKNDINYKNYGDRGIVVCERWHNMFLFLEDMGKAPSPKHSLERNDVNDGYHPLNCRWATAKEQGRNKRNNRFIEIDGVTKSLSEWCEYYKVYGKKYFTIRDRINKGVDPKEAFTTPLGIKKNLRLIEFGGITKSLAEWCRDLGVGKDVISGRLERGWSVSDALTTPKLGNGIKYRAIKSKRYG